MFCVYWIARRLAVIVLSYFGRRTDQLILSEKSFQFTGMSEPNIELFWNDLARVVINDRSVKLYDKNKLRWELYFIFFYGLDKEQLKSDFKYLDVDKRILIKG